MFSIQTRNICWWLLITVPQYDVHCYVKMAIDKFDQPNSLEISILSVGWMPHNLTLCGPTNKESKKIFLLWSNDLDRLNRFGMFGSRCLSNWQWNNLKSALTALYRKLCHNFRRLLSPVGLRRTSTHTHTRAFGLMMKAFTIVSLRCIGWLNIHLHT